MNKPTEHIQHGNEQQLEMYYLEVDINERAQASNKHTAESNQVSRKDISNDND
jgi:hypothetical protein